MSARQAVVTVVQHLAFEDLGSFAQPLRELGHAIRVVQAGVDNVAQAIDDAELNLPDETADLLGPLSPAAKRALEVAMPIMRPLLNGGIAIRGARPT